MKNFKLVSAIFIFCLSSVNANINKSFRVKLTGPVHKIETIKKKAEYKLAKNIDFCRGFFVPVPIGKWECSQSGPGTSECLNNYQCKRVHKSFNRVTETKRILKELKALPVSTEKYHVVVYKKPVTSPRIPRYRTPINKVAKKSFSEYKKFPMKKLIKKRPVIQRKILKEEKNIVISEIADLEDNLELIDSGEEINKISLNTLEEEEELQKLLEGDDTILGNGPKAKYRVQTARTTDGAGKVYKVRPINSLDKENTGGHKMFSFGISGAKIQDINGDSVATLDGAWTPRWRLNDSWRVRGRAGSHFIKAEIDEVSETFFVLNFGASIEYSVTDNWYLDLGFGIQRWFSSTGGVFGTTTLGGGYQFDLYKLSVIDRLFFEYTSVGNEDQNQEILLGVGISF